jgi:hypothetical protein
MGFRKGSILANLHSYGFLDSETTTKDAVAAVSNKKKVLLARRLLRRQVRQPKYQEHRRNDIWMHHLEKAREKDGFFVERYYHMTQESFDKLVNLLDLPRMNEAKSRNSTRGVDPKSGRTQRVEDKVVRNVDRTGQPLHGCKLALDGFLSARINPNVEDDAHYHSIHKKIHCLNVQATIDYLLLFSIRLCCSAWKNKQWESI